MLGGPTRGQAFGAMAARSSACTTSRSSRVPGSKSCKAVKQEQRTGQYAAHKNKVAQKLHPYVDNEVYLEHQREYGGIPHFNRRGEYEGFTMTPEDLSYGGYNNAGPDDPFGDGKW